MAQSTAESEVQVQPDSTGKQIRTLGLQTDINGVVTLTQTQVVALSDGIGNIVNDFGSAVLEEAILRELKAIRIILSTAFGVLVDPNQLQEL